LDYDRIRTKEIIGKVIPKHCKRLEDLNVDEIYTVCRIKPITFRDVDKYVLVLKKERELEGTYLSNAFLEEEINNKNIDIGIKFNFRTSGLRTTKTKKKLQYVIVSDATQHTVYPVTHTYIRV